MLASELWPELDGFEDGEWLRMRLAQSAYSVIDTSVDTSGFALSGNASEDWKKYDELTTKINNAKAAATALDNYQRSPLMAQVNMPAVRSAEQNRIENQGGGMPPCWRSCAS